MRENQRFVWLDLVRGISAIAVCAGHLRAALICDYGDLQSPASLPQKLFYFVTGLGHEAVMVFFVLSGLFVGGTVLKKGSSFSLISYAIARLTRLWIVLIPALAFTFLSDHLTAHYFPEVFDGAYHQFWNSGPAPGNYSSSVITFLGNIFFLQTILVPVFGSNGPLWSLSNEFWYYLLFPLFAFVAGRCGKSKSLPSKSVATLIAITVLLLLPPAVQTGFLVWMMGVAVYWRCNHLSYKPRPIALLLSSLAFAAALAYSRIEAWQSGVKIPSDYVVGLGFSAFCIVIATWPALQSRRIGGAVNSLASGLSEFSYSLYLIHFPLVIMIAAFNHKGTKRQPDWDGMLSYSGCLVILLLIGVVFWYAFERHTPTLRKWVAARIDKPSTPPELN